MVIGVISLESEKNGISDFGCLVIRATVAMAVLTCAVLSTICLFISPDLDGHRAPKMTHEGGCLLDSPPLW